MSSRTTHVRSLREAVALRLAAAALLATAVLPAISCGSETVRTGQSPVYLVIKQLTATAGGTDEESGELSSDVCIHQETAFDVTSCGAFEDLATVTMVVAGKDISAPLTSNNLVTINRYHVTFRRADGRNTPGVDVPYSFDGALTFTASETAATGSFVLVRIQSKFEPPLVGLTMSTPQALSISTIADITFYGRDQVGREVSATGSISVNFADWADPNKEE